MDGLERDLTGQVEVVRVDILSSIGRTIAGQYGVVAVPTMLLIDGDGRIITQQSGIPDRRLLREQAIALQQVE